MIPLPRAGAYSVQTHEQLIDLTWKPAIVPLLLSRFPTLTPAELREAHAYAYGGCAIQDVGYYPFGNAFFSDLTHYVRAGEFVQAMLRDAKTANELAFAVGALSHYIGDNAGHSLATNVSVPQEFPDLAAKYGQVVTYEESPHAHVRTEFAFDINEISKRRFAPFDYLKHVGLKVASTLLAKAFYETYGLHLEEVLGKQREKGSIGGYEFAVRSFLPRIAYAETVLHKNKMPTDVQDEEFSTFEKALAQSDLENGWEPYRKKPGFGTHMLAGLIVVLPKFGALSGLAIKGPDETTEQSYVKSVNVATASLRHVLGDLERDGSADLATDLPNRDLDTGKRVRPGGYRLTDETYAKLLGKLTSPKSGPIPAGLKDDVEQYYADAAAPIATKKNAKKWAAVQNDLLLLEQKQVIPEP